MKKVALLLTSAAFLASTAFALGGSPDQQTLATNGTGNTNTKLYHSYDGLICTDCHTLHDVNDAANVSGQATAGYTPLGANSTGFAYQHLLKRGNSTDVCLSCHRQGNNTAATANMNGVVDSGWTAPIVMTTGCAMEVDNTPAGISMPAGDFCYSNLDVRAGHNPAYTLMDTAPSALLITPDPDLLNIPPGNPKGPIPVSEADTNDPEWSCHSCHGMHSRFSADYIPYRQLMRGINNTGVGASEQTSAQSNTATPGKAESWTNGTSNFVTEASGYEAIKSNSRGDLQKDANNHLVLYKNVRNDGNPLEGADLFQAYSDTNKNVYRGGFSAFCAGCHGLIHGGNAGAAGSEGTQALQGTNVLDTNAGYIRHPTNLKLGQSLVAKYGISPTTPTGYNKQVNNIQNTSPNPLGYDFRYPLIQPDTDFTVKTTVASAGVQATALVDDRISCLTCHKAHASQYKNMTRWDTRVHGALLVGEKNPFGKAFNSTTNSWRDETVSTDDNPAFGCQKCHQKGGANAFKIQF